MNPTSVTAGATVTITATDVEDTSAKVTRVAFYTGERSDGRGEPDKTDYLIGYAACAAGSIFIRSRRPRAAWRRVRIRIYAVAIDADGDVSDPLATTLTVLAASTTKNSHR